MKNSPAVLTLSIRAALLLASVAGAHAATVLIDFSTATSEPGAADSNGNRWTTIGAVGTNGAAANTSATNLISSTGAATTIDIGIVFVNTTAVGFGGVGINGPAGPAPFNQSFAVIDGIYSAYTSAASTVTFSGLAANTPYDLSLIGGRASSGSNGVITRTTGTGGTGGALLNDGTVLNFTVTSDNSGVIGFTFADSDPVINNPGATLNAMSLTQVPEPGMFALLSLSGLLLLVRRRA